MPYLAGYILTSIFNKRETSQIETYLTGFFFVFLLQGIEYALLCFVGGSSFNSLCQAYICTYIALAIVFAIAFVIRLIKQKRSGKHTINYHAPMSREDWILTGIIAAIALLIIIKIFVLKDYLRTDLMLANVRTILSTDSIYEYNPITSHPFTIGLIASKRIISLPVYYACLCRIFAIDEIVLLYIVLTLQTIMCTYFSCILFIAPVFHNRHKTLIFAIFLGAMILSGDYFSGSIGAKLCWNGYSGEAIVPCVMIPYLMYIITDWYRRNRDPEADLTIGEQVIMTLQLALCIVPSFFMTSITTGILLLIINAIVLALCCLVRFRKEGAS